MELLGYKRPDGQVGVRNKCLIIAVDECCDGIARKIAGNDDDVVVLTNAYTCMLGGNEEIYNQMIAVGKNPNVAACLVVAMGCGSISVDNVAQEIKRTGKEAFTLTSIKERGTKNAINEGRKILTEMKQISRSYKRELCPIEKLIVGVKCGGSDTSSGMASNPSVGAMVDKIVNSGGSAIGGELMELLGCEKILKERCACDLVKKKVDVLIDNEEKRWSVEGTEVETMSIGNSIGGLTTLEEKSLGALHKMGHGMIQDVLQVNKDFISKVEKPGFYLSETTMLCGGSAVNYAAFGAQIIIWTTGGAGFNNPLIPVIRVSGNKDLVNDDIDIDCSLIMEGKESVEENGDKIFDKVVKVFNGEMTNIENLGASTMTLYQKDQRVETLLNLPCHIK